MDAKGCGHGKDGEAAAAATVSKITARGMYPGWMRALSPRWAYWGKAWVFRFRANGRRHDAGLGPFPLVTLAEAREKADTFRRQRLEGKNPLET